MTTFGLLRSTELSEQFKQANLHRPDRRRSRGIVAISLIIFFLVTSGCSSPLDPPPDAAGAPEDTQDWTAIASSYNQIRSSGRTSADLCFNEGNAWYRAGDIPRARAAWLAGHRLLPSHSGIRTHLPLTDPQTPLASPIADSVAPVYVIPVSSAVPLGTAALLLIGVLTVITRLFPNSAAGQFCLRIVMSLTLPGAIYLLSWWCLWDRAPRAVVGEEDIDYHTGPGKSFEVAGKLTSGDDVVVVRRTANWVQIQTAVGAAGWVRENTLHR